MTERPDSRVPRDADGVPAGRGVAARAARVAAKAARAAATVAGKSGQPEDGGAEATPFAVSGERVRTVPEATVGRLAIYLRVLSAFAEKGTTTVSSDALAAAAGVNSAKLRKDLSHLGSYGTRGVGYEVGILVEQISRALGLTRHRSVALVGVGNLGHALAGYGGFATRGFHVAALIDADPARVGERIAGLVVSHIDDLDTIVRTERVSIGVIATPAEAAQPVCDRLVAAGVTSILNFAPVVLSVPDNVDVRKVDLAVELQILSFHEERKSGAPGASDWGEVG